MKQKINHNINIEMKKIFNLTAMMSLLALPAMADNAADANEPAGFLASALNSAIEKAWEAPAEAPAADEKALEYGRNVKDNVSAPKFGGYYIGKYSYSDKQGAKGGAGFGQRLIRFYVDGTILKDFKYRIQMQCNNDAFHMKDVFIEWQKYKFAMIKIGQFKRAFGFENPMNPWDISTGDYSLMTKKLTGHDDYLNALSGNAADLVKTANGGRDQGLQIQGDFLKVGEDNHNLIHYQVGIWNGVGINKADNNGKKDVIGTIQFQPIKNLYIGAFGWHGSVLVNGHDYDRNRYAFGLKYDNEGWTLRSEWAHGQSGLGNADAWYVVGGMPINDWFRIVGQYQTYRKNKTWEKAQVIYSLIPEFRLHKNLMFQVQYNFNNDRNLATDHHNFNEVWLETYFRF